RTARGAPRDPSHPQAGRARDSQRAVQQCPPSGARQPNADLDDVAPPARAHASRLRRVPLHATRDAAIPRRGGLPDPVLPPERLPAAEERRPLGRLAEPVLQPVPPALARADLPPA